ncbi:hypothetical protein K2173_002972 [Erythroxylum novogranatense]|uniref:DUF4283 domain-containing protein n=1 Tax=Erythroxylum novogranatense TaxID=1862640 RepID=A0AAV8TRA3_9ROSI|nr:hypothetical protein K2173_002972 [Erythroxylum novogranatense]
MESLDPAGHPTKKGRTCKREDEPSQPKQSYIAAIIRGHAEGNATTHQGCPDEEPVEVAEGDITPVFREQGGSIILSQNFKDKLDKQRERAVVLRGYETLRPSGSSNEEGEQGGSILLSQNFKDKLDKQWERAVVLKVLGRRVGFAVLRNQLQMQWKLRGKMKMVDLDNEFFLVKFQEEGDYFRVLTEGPWVVFRQVIAVQRWSPSFRPSQAAVSRVVVWVRIPKLRFSHYHPRILSALGDLIGSTVRLDEETMLANCGKFT